MIRKITMILVLAILLCGACRAAGDDPLSAQTDALDLGGLEQAAGEYAVGGVNTDLNTGLFGILERGAGETGKMFRKAVGSGVVLICIVLLCSVLGGMEEAGGNGAASALPMACALSIAAVAVSDASTLIGLGSRAIESMEAFSKVLLPTMTAAAAASGSPAGATARQLATLLFSDILMTVIRGLLLPLTYGYIAACTAHAAIGNPGLGRIATTLKWVVTSVLTLILLAFTGYLSVTGVIAGAADAATVKAAKFTMSSLVPVVGGILSDAAETVLAGAGILRNAVGIFGMLAILGMCITPFLYLGGHYLIYKAASALAATVADSRACALIDNIGSAFGLVLGMTASCALLLLVSLISAISVVTP